ncbi:MAG: PaaI family thioesterase [Ekhidna sp.]|nr:PaaI family thioesterase [Ekhidna sp.]
MKEEHYKKLENMYLQANINKQIFDTTTCTISEGEARIGLTVTKKYFHALNAMHGSVYFKLLDDAAFFSVSSLVTDVFVLTKNFNISFKRPVTTGTITAIGTIIDSTGSSFNAKAELYNEDGKIVGSGTGEFVKSKTALTPEIGYR